MPRLSSSERKATILEAARRLMLREKTLYVTADQIAAECDVTTSPSTVRRYFHSMADLRAEVVETMPRFEAER